MQKEPTHHLFNAPDALVSYWEWGNPAHQTILLIHATGFHARVWDQTIKHLPDDLHIIAVDQRGHGQSGKHGLLLDWKLPADDVEALIKHLDLTDIIGVGHSMGGHNLVQQAARNPDRFQRLLLLDPVILPPERYALDQDSPHDDPFKMPVSKRRNDWDNWEALHTRLKDQHPYSLWKPEALVDYCRYGVLPKENGEGYELACPPIMEASVYTGSPRSKITHLAHHIHQPVTIIRARQRKEDEAAIMDFAISPTWTELAHEFPDAIDVLRDDLSHFIPMQAPELTARYIMDREGEA